jgi:hypothetical protein
MRAHPQKAAVEAPLLAQEDRVDRGRHVVIWIFYSYRRPAAGNLLILLGQVWNLALT